MGVELVRVLCVIVSKLEGKMGAVKLVTLLIIVAECVLCEEKGVFKRDKNRENVGHLGSEFK